MAQSLNKRIDFQTTGVFYVGIGNKVGKFLLGDKSLEFYPDDNVEQFIQIPWDSIQQIGANVHKRRINKHFQVFTDQGKFLFASKDSGKLLKIARNYLGNEKIVKLPTLLQLLGKKLFGK